MYFFIKFICIIFLLKYSSSYRLKPNNGLTFSLTNIFENKFCLNSESNDDIKNKLKEIDEVEFTTEGWLMDLNEKNVEGVFDLVRDQFRNDGGGIELVKIVDHVVYVVLTGSCVGCPLRSTTLKDVVQVNLRKFLKSPNDSPIRVEVVENDNNK